MTPDNAYHTTPVPPTGRSAPQGLRLRLDPTLARGGILDGGWWPRSRDPDAELPDLIAGLESSLGAITRVALNPEPWDGAPRPGCHRRSPRSRGLVPRDERPHDLPDQSLPGSLRAAGGTAAGDHGGGDDRDGDGSGRDQQRPASQPPGGQRDWRPGHRSHTPPRRPQERATPLLDGQSGRPAAVSGGTPQEADKPTTRVGCG